MKAIKLIAIILLFTSTIFKSEAQNSENTSGIEVYYFHATNRCETCEAVEAVTKEALKQFYGDQIILKLVNRDEEKNKALVEKYQIAWQTLLVLKGDKKVDITSIAFMNARTKPWKLKAKIKDTIDHI